MAGASSVFKWDKLEQMPTKRVFSTPVDVDGILYVVGGCDQRGTPLDTLESYNPKKNKWMRLASMPSKRAGVCAVAVGKKIVALGGVNTSQEPVDAVEIYDIEKKKWLGKDDGIETLKDRLLGISGVVKDGKVIVVGGMAFDTNPKDYLMSYDLESNKWKSLPAMPTARYATFSFLIGEKFYVLGGRQGKVPVASCEMYDFSSGVWSTLPDIPSKRVFALYINSDTHIFSIGGLKKHANDGFSDVIELLDLQTEKWTVGKSMADKRGDFAVGLHDGKVVVAGGLGNHGKPMCEVEIYDMATDTWTSLPSLPTSHCSCAFITFNERLHVIGGLSTGGPSSAVEALNVPQTS